jgi:ZIP family zinc transporter
MTGGEGFAKVMPAAFGFPWCLIYGIDKVLPHLHINFKISEGIKSPWQRTTLLVSQLHITFEGLAVGVLLVESQLGFKLLLLGL